MSQSKRKLYIYSALIVLILLSCTISQSKVDQAGTAVAGTLTAEAINNPVVPVPGDSGASGAAAPTDTLAPDLSTDTPTVPPTITFTPTPSIPMVSVSVNTNCRTGNSTAFEIIGQLLVGQKAEVVGVPPAGPYVIIKNPNGGPNCWLYTQYATITGNLNGLPTVPYPATPTPTPVPLQIVDVDISVDDDYVLGACPHTFNLSARIHVTGSGTVTYHWVFAGTAQPDKTVSFDGDGYKDVTTTWDLGTPGNDYINWLVQVKITDPGSKLSNKLFVSVECDP